MPSGRPKDIAFVTASPTCMSSGVISAGPSINPTMSQSLLEPPEKTSADTCNKENSSEVGQDTMNLSILPTLLDGPFEPAFLADEEGTILHMNPSALRLFKLDAPGFGNIHVSDFLKLFPVQEMSTDSDPKKRATCLLLEEINEGPTLSWEDVLGGLETTKYNKYMGAGSKRDFTVFPISANLIKVKGCYRSFVQHSVELDPNASYVCAYIHDCSADHLIANLKNENELEHMYNLTKGVLDAAFDAMFAIDVNGIILMVNDASTKQFGWSKEEFLGKSVSMIVGTEHAAKHDRYIRKYIESGVARVMGTQRVLMARRKDGSEFPVWLGLTEVASNSEENHCRFVAFVRDLTDKKKLLEMTVMYAKAQELLQNMLPEEYFQCIDR